MMKTRLLTQTVKAFRLFLSVGVAFLLVTESNASVSANASSWQSLAKKVGTSEDVRGAAIQQLKSMKGLEARLKKAIYTADRPLALDVISALDLKNMIPDLLLHVPADPDGFLTVAVNAMMTEKNQSQILSSYQETLEPSQMSRVSPGAIVAMLEPLGRLNVKVSKPILQALKEQASPEVRSSLLYYLRVMALRHGVTENLGLVTELLKAKEFQLRLQAVSVTSEVLKTKLNASSLADRASLKSSCETEKAKQIREACLSFLADGEAK